MKKLLSERLSPPHFLGTQDLADEARALEEENADLEHLRTLHKAQIARLEAQERHLEQELAETGHLRLL